MRVVRIAVLIGLMTVPALMLRILNMTPGFRLNEDKQLRDEEICAQQG